MDISERLNFLAEFPELISSKFEVTSPKTAEYNCIAWAAGEDDRWWWPDRMGQKYWPKGVRRVVTMEAFVAAYETLGFRKCDDQSLEAGYEKLAIFLSDAGHPTHAARQLPSGLWTSKMGRSFDISHELHGLGGGAYGEPVLVMKRSITRN
jgi:hypothetical protein